jgi:hypothetical protein
MARDEAGDGRLGDEAVGNADARIGDFAVFES